MVVVMVLIILLCGMVACFLFFLGRSMNDDGYLASNIIGHQREIIQRTDIIIIDTVIHIIM